MIATDGDVLATLRLVQGRSDVVRRELHKTAAKTLLTVGTDARCDWRVEDIGVAPVHFSLLWDGSALLVANTYEVGRVHVDGVALGSEWRRLARLARIDFGSAALVVETLSARPSAGAEREPTTLPGIALPKAAATPIVIGPNGSARASSPLRSVPASLSGTLSGVGAHVIDRPQLPNGALVDLSPGWTSKFEATPAPLVVASVEASKPPSSGSILSMAAEDAERGIPKAVLVLSPTRESEDPDPDEEVAGRSSIPMRAPSLPSWRQVGLGVLAVVVGYVCWLYLLYNL